MRCVDIDFGDDQSLDVNRRTESDFIATDCHYACHNNDDNHGY